ncbi:LTA synthase family protein [Aliivibrio kagoshimensis]|uniref:LTA synthase family protein n=1 Tax=Aliivibrio kagoshimensis TaxID=2910230 RepID=UPI003D0A1408
MFLKNTRHLNHTIWVQILTITLILFCARVIFFLNVGHLDLFTEKSSDLQRAFFTGFRFDIKVAAIAFAPLFLLGLFTASFSSLYSKLRAIFPWYGLVICFLVTAFSIGNYYYFKTYGNHFDLFVYGFFDDDTEAVMKNAWADYPIIRSFLASILVTAVYVAVMKRVNVNRIEVDDVKRHKGVMTGLVIISVLGIAFFARGSLGTFPLKRYHAHVSEVDIINKITPNALLALEWAKTDYKNQGKFDVVDASALKAQMQKVLGKPNTQFTTEKNSYLAENKPHVVMALMEGMGANVLIEDDYPRNDVLGSLRSAFDDDYLFTRFLAETSATIDTIVNMVAKSNVPTIGHSSAQKQVIEGRAMLPYKQAGYKTIFITAGNGMWRNVANYLPMQGFDLVLDENSIKDAFPESAQYAAAWGLPDEYVFKLANKLLDEAQQPLFIYLLTVTNHTPYKAPNSYSVKPIKASEQLLTRMGDGEEEAEALLSTYQYAADSLGNFIASIKNSDLGKQTVIAATGDHRIRGFTLKEPDDLALKHAVPFYLYLPQPIKERVELHYDPKRVGSHKDIFPTLYAFSLSEANYSSLGGRNMLAESDTFSFGFNPELTLTEQGVFKNKQPEKLYRWSDKTMLTTELTESENNQPNVGNDYQRLATLYINDQVTR